MIEIKAFFALLLSMGQQDLQDYWSLDPVLSTPFFSSVMTRDRFLVLLTFLHCSDNNNYVPWGQEGYDPLYKLGTIYDTIRNLFSTNYYPTKNLAVDEGLVPCRGNIHFRVYNPDKPDKFGIMSYQLCDDRGYCCQYELYPGKRGGGSEYGATYDLCMRLMDRYKNRGHHLYVDNFYTSPILFSHLYEQGTGACGTLRVNRKHVPESIKKGNPAKGNQIVTSNGPLMVTKFHDRFHHTQGLYGGYWEEDQRYIRAHTEAICCPGLQQAHGQCEQLVQYLAMRRRTLKWYKKVLFHMMDLCTVQAYIIYKMVTNKPVLHRVFKRELVKEILASTELPRATSSGRPRAAAPESPKAQQ